MRISRAIWGTAFATIGGMTVLGLTGNFGNIWPIAVAFWSIPILITAVLLDLLVRMK